MLTEKVRIRVKASGLGIHSTLGELKKGDIHYLPRNKVGTNIFDILDIKYKGSLYSRGDIVALHRKAKKHDKRNLAAIMVERGIKKTGGKYNASHRS